MDAPELSLYLHIPFCRQKCDYCDFFSLPTGRFAARDSSRYIDALLAETERRLGEAKAEYGVSVPSVYIGGGTPSILGEAGITRLLEGIQSLAGLSKEITVEANPETADPAFLSACALHGVTRLSLGIQSFDETLLQSIGRSGRKPAGGASFGPCPPSGNSFDKKKRRAALGKTLARASELFGNGLSLDVMSGLPGQSVSMLLSDIEQALSYRPGHISLYALSVEEGTPLAKRLKKNTDNRERADDAPCQGDELPLQLPTEESAETLWISGRDALKQAGYDHYEVSNFARTPAARSLHNIRYWLMKNWLGIGPAASGTIISDGGTGRRVSYVSDVEGFCSAALDRHVPPLIVEELDRATVLKETLLMGFRYIEGPDRELFIRRFGKTVEETIPRTLARWYNKRGDVSGEQNAGQGTNGGTRAAHETIMNFQNRFLLDAFNELDESGDSGEHARRVRSERGAIKKVPGTK